MGNVVRITTRGSVHLGFHWYWIHAFELNLLQYESIAVILGSMTNLCNNSTIKKRIFANQPVSFNSTHLE